MRSRTGETRLCSNLTAFVALLLTAGLAAACSSPTVGEEGEQDGIGSDTTPIDSGGLDPGPDAGSATDAAGGDEGPDGDGADGGGFVATWSDLGVLPGGPLQAHGVAGAGAKVFLLGGYVPGEGVEYHIDARVWAYDIGEASWTESTALPEALVEPNVAAVGDEVFVIGGGTDASTAVPSAWRRAADTGEWSALSAIEDARARFAAAVGTDGTSIWLAGGLRPGSVAFADRYDLAGDSYTPLPDLPAARNSAMGAVVGGTFYVIGGRVGDEFDIDDIHADVWALAPGSDDWEARASMPTARADAAVAVVEGRIVVLGGEGKPVGATGVFPDVEAYDPATDTWSTLPDMPTPRHAMGAAALDGVLYVPGGAEVRLVAPSDVFEALTLSF